MKIFVVTELISIDEDDHINPEKYGYLCVKTSVRECLQFILDKDIDYVKAMYYTDNPKIEMNLITDCIMDESPEKDIYKLETKYHNNAISRYIIIQETIDGETSS